jgi:hypothetical protein
MSALGALGRRSGRTRPRLAWAARAAAGAALLLLSACAIPTAYEPAFGGEEGYSDQKLEDNHYRVTFAGNSLTSRETVENYLLYRCAEITLKTGNDYFVVLEKSTERSVSYRYYPPPSASLRRYGYPYWHPYGLGYVYPPFYDPFWDMPVTAEPIETYKAYATIAVFQGKKPAGDPNAFDAREVIANLGPTLRRPAP